MYSGQIDFRRMGSAALVCEWKTAIKNDVLNNSTESPEDLGDVNCFYVNLYNFCQCKPLVKLGDFRAKLFCGNPSYPSQINTWVITLNTLYIDIIL